MAVTIFAGLLTAASAGNSSPPYVTRTFPFLQQLPYLQLTSLLFPLLFSSLLSSLLFSFLLSATFKPTCAGDSCFDTMGKGPEGIKGDNCYFGDGLGSQGTAADNCQKYFDIGYCTSNSWVSGSTSPCKRTCGLCVPDTGSSFALIRPKGKNTHFRKIGF